MNDGGSRNEQLVREFFTTLSTGDLEALRALLHADGSWEVMGLTIPGAGLTEGRDAVIDEFLAPVRRLFEDGDPKVHVKRMFSSGDLVAAVALAVAVGVGHAAEPRRPEADRLHPHRAAPDLSQPFVHDPLPPALAATLGVPRAAAQPGHARQKPAVAST